MLARCLASLLTFSCLALKSSSACCCTRKYTSEFCRDFISPSTSCRSTADWCLSACSWDWRSRSDSGSKFEELVPAILASNSNTTSTQDYGVFSLSTRSFLSPSLETNRLSHYLEPYLHYFLYHCIVGCSSPIFCSHSTRETRRHITGLACSIRNSFW